MASEALKEIVLRVVQDIEKKNLDILKLWEKAVGRRIAQHTKPVSFKHGLLVVNVDSVGWLFELNIFKSLIFQKVKRLIKDKKLESIRFRIGKV